MLDMSTRISMALAHTILALLAKEPGSGYDISKHFDEGLSCYWKATQQQVYRELGKLKKEGWAPRWLLLTWAALIRLSPP